MTTDRLAKQLEEKEQECKELEQELEFWKKEGDRIHLLMLEKRDELVKEILKNDQLKVENEILEKDKANLDVIIETLKAQFSQLEKENVKLKELVKTRIEDLCDSCGASSMMPMPCKVYEQALQEIENIAKNYFNNDWTGLAIILEQILEKCEVLKDE